MKALYFAGGSGRDKLFYEISKQLTEVDAVFVATVEEGVDFLKKKKAKHCEIFTKYPRKISYNLKKLRHYEKEYGVGVWEAWSVTFPRRNNWKVGKEQVWTWSQYVIERVEEILEKEKPDMLITYGPASYLSIFLQRVCEKKGVRVIELVHSRLRDRFTIKDNLEDRWPLLDEKYDKNEKLSEKERKQVERLWDQLASEEKLAQSEDKWKETKVDFVKRVGSWTWRHIRERKIPPEVILLRRGLKKQLLLRSNIFEKSLENEKYAFFPLHMQPEASTLIYGKWFVDQVPLVESVAKALPADHMLYVKEHPKVFGNRTREFHERISRLPNVRLIHPHAKTMELIKNSSFVVTITGTVGFEALLRQRPVLAFGDVYYTKSKNVFKVERPSQLPKTVTEALNFKPDKEEVLRFLFSLWESTYPGLCLLPGDTKGRSLEPDNVKRLAEGIRAYCKERYGMDL